MMLESKFACHTHTHTFSCVPVFIFLCSESSPSPITIHRHDPFSSLIPKCPVFTSWKLPMKPPTESPAILFRGGVSSSVCLRVCFGSPHHTVSLRAGAWCQPRNNPVKTAGKGRTTAMSSNPGKAKAETTWSQPGRKKSILGAGFGVGVPTDRREIPGQEGGLPRSYSRRLSSRRSSPSPPPPMPCQPNWSDLQPPGRSGRPETPGRRHQHAQPRARDRYPPPRLPKRPETQPEGSR